MRTGELTDFYSDTLQIARGTVAAQLVELQRDGDFSRGTRGRNSGADVTEMDCTNLLLALTLDAPRGESVVPIVRRARRMTHDERPIALPHDFAQGLQCFFKATAGIALDSVIADFRFGTFEKWADGEEFKLSVGIDSRGVSVFLSASKPKRNGNPLDYRNIIAGFGRHPLENQRPLIERQVTLRGEWFRQLAERLGPRPAT
jgi:hypothetical protein